MKKTLRVVVGLLAVLVVAVVGTFVWATIRSSNLRSRTIDTHLVDFPIPFPLDDSEIATLPAEADPDSVAMVRAIERGRHLVDSRYACSECHGQDFGGGVMVDDPALGRFLGPNITLGDGSRTLTYQASDWDRVVRHGVRPGGTPAVMPSVDFELMSDQELSDIVAYLRSMPPIDNVVPDPTLGPLGRVLVAAGQLPFSADLIDHEAPHSALPPEAAVSAEFGEHLAGVCVGCHGENLAGGPIVGGDPSWPPARNLTPHVDGLAGWSYEDFRRVLLQAMRPDGTPVETPMDMIVPFAENMTDVEIEALWTYVQSIPPAATPE